MPPGYYEEGQKIRVSSQFGVSLPGGDGGRKSGGRRIHRFTFGSHLMERLVRHLWGNVRLVLGGRCRLSSDTKRGKGSYREEDSWRRKGLGKENVQQTNVAVYVL